MASVQRGATMAVAKSKSINEDRSMLKRVDDSTFVEIDIAKGFSRPLEWRRNFNPIVIEGTGQVVKSWSVNEIDRFSVKVESNDLPKVKGENASARTTLSLKFSTGSLRDMFYFTSERSKKAGDIVGISLVDGDVACVIQAQAPFSKDIFVQVYGGQIFEDASPTDTPIHLSLGAPQATINDLARSVIKDPSAKIRIVVNVLSFSSEVEDALSEPHNSRRLLIDGTSAAFLSHIQLVASGAIANDPIVGEGRKDERQEEASVVDPWTARSDRFVASMTQLRNAFYVLAAIVGLAIILSSGRCMIE